MAGYSRQSIADIIANAVIKAAPVNAEYNALRDTFAFATGHKHDGSSTEGAYVPLIADVDALNKVVVDTNNNRISFFSEVGATAVEQLRIQDGAIVAVTNNDIDLGSIGAEFKDLYIDGIGYIDNIAVHENATIDGFLTVTGLSTLASVDINAGNIDATQIGAASPSTITGTTVTATNLVGPLAGAVTGNVTGNLAGNVTGNVTGDLTGNVTAGSGTSSFNNVTINGSLDLNAGTAATVTGLSAPTAGTDATTKTYVDAADALKLNLTGGTLSGAVEMSTNKITGLGTPTATTDAATKGYVDQEVTAVIAAAPGALDTLNELAAAINDDANFSTTITNSIATKLPKAGGTMTGAIAMSTNLITGLGTPVSSTDATTKAYVDTADALKLPLAGGTLTGTLAMSTSKITGLGTPTAGTDASTKAYVDSGDALKVTKAGDTMSGVLAMGANKITGVSDPTAAQDASTKNYTDVLFGSTTDAATSAGQAASSATAAANSASGVATSATNAANSATAAAASYDSFDDRYLGAKSSNPTVDNDGDALVTGALHFNTTAASMRVYNGSSWADAGSAVNGTATRVVYTATASQTSFAVIYDAGYVDVYLNGIKLVLTVDYNGSSGTAVVLTTGATVGDIVDIVAYGAFNVANVYTQTASDARFEPIDSAYTKAEGDALYAVASTTTTADAALPKTGGAMTGAITTNSTFDGVDIATRDAILTSTTTTAGAALPKAGGTLSGTIIAADNIIQGPVLKDYAETKVAMAANDVDLSLGNVQTKTISGAATLTFSNPPASGSAGSFTLILTNGGSATVTWPTSVDWPAATAPTLTASGVDVLTFVTIDGGTIWYGVASGIGMA